MKIPCILLLICSIVEAAFGGTAGFPPPPSGRTFHRAVTIGDQVFVVGGFEASADETCQQMDVLDTKTRKWTRHKLPFKVSAVTLPARLGDELYVVDVDTPMLRRYSIAKEEWVALQAPSVARPHSTLVAHKGKLVLLGGYSKGITEKNCVEIYDPVEDSWSIGPPMPGFKEGDHFHLAAVIDENLHVVGHYFGGKSHRVFDGDRWTTLGDSPFDCGWKSAILESVNGRLFLFDVIHSDPSAKKGAVHTFDPSTARWELVGATPEGFPLMLGAGASTGNEIIVLGGHPDPSSVFSYNVEKKVWQSSETKLAEQDGAGQPATRSDSK